MSGCERRVVPGPTGGQWRYLLEGFGAGLLAGLLGARCEVYNAGLQERRDAWKMAGQSIALFDQFNQITLPARCA